MDLEEWEKVRAAIAEKFSGGESGEIGGNWLSPLIEAERQRGYEIIQQYNGFDYVENAFFDFFIETLTIAGKFPVHGGLPDSDRSYPLIYLTFRSLFRGLRAASILKNYGYPLPGFAALRDQTTRAIELSAVANEMTDILSIYGLERPGQSNHSTDPTERGEIVGRRTNERNRVMRLMAGKDSGLEVDDIAELKKIRVISNEELHQGTLAIFNDLRIIAEEQRLPSVAPEPHRDELDIASYINRASETEWMVLRLLPYLQLAPRAFGENWAVRWGLLDTGYRGLVESLGKPVSRSFTRMIDAKFAFDPYTCYRVEGASPFP